VQISRNRLPGGVGWVLGAELAVVQLGVQPVSGREPGMGALGHQVALVEDQDRVRGQDGG
jgi:hypothetical protein